MIESFAFLSLTSINWGLFLEDVIISALVARLWCFILLILLRIYDLFIIFGWFYFKLHLFILILLGVFQDWLHDWEIERSAACLLLFCPECIPLRPKLLLLDSLEVGTISISLIVAVDDFLEAPLLMTLGVRCLSSENVFMIFSSCTDIW